MQFEAGPFLYGMWKRIGRNTEEMKQLSVNSYSKKKQGFNVLNNNTQLTPIQSKKLFN